MDGKTNAQILLSNGVEIIDGIDGVLLNCTESSISVSGLYPTESTSSMATGYIKNDIMPMYGTYFVFENGGNYSTTFNRALNISASELQRVFDIWGFSKLPNGSYILRYMVYTYNKRFLGEAPFSVSDGVFALTDTVVNTYYGRSYDATMYFYRLIKTA